VNAPERPSVAQLKERVRRDWTDRETIAAWGRWREPFAMQTTSLTEALLAAAEIEPGLRVLDLASGAGEPALTLARRLGREGRVTATDLSRDWLSIIEDAALAEGIDTIDFEIADAHALPFEDASFDRVTSRLGVMFFADVQRALAECRRVLRPDGRVAFLAWGEPQKNAFFATVMRALGSRVEVAPPAPGMPGPLRFAAPGSLSRELEQAGFREIEDERMTVPLPWPGPPEQLWQHFRDVVAPLRPAIDGLSDEDREAVGAEVVAAYTTHYDGTRVALTAEVVVVTALP
jgi:ubiquinone/menaquinone biosynthesis C-methylase UbiE